MPVKKQFLKSKPEVKVTFEVGQEAAAEAKAVYVLCEAMDWQKCPLKHLKSGGFKASFNLPTDQQDDYEYRFCYEMQDGTERYDNDWQAESYRPTPMGHENSVVSVHS